MLELILKLRYQFVKTVPWRSYSSIVLKFSLEKELDSGINMKRFV